MILSRYLFSTQQTLDHVAPTLNMLAGAVLLGVFASYLLMLPETFISDFFALWFRTIFYLILAYPYGLAVVAMSLGSFFLVPHKLLPRHQLSLVPFYLCLWTLTIKAFDGRYALHNPTFSDFWTLIWAQILFACLLPIMLYAYKGERLFFCLVLLNATIWFLFCNDVTYANSQVWP